MKAFIGDCVGNPFNSSWKLNFIIDNGKEVSRKEFLATCDVPCEVELEMSRYPNDYEFFKSYEGVMYYTWSAIEHFFR